MNPPTPSDFYVAPCRRPGFQAARRPAPVLLPDALGQVLAVRGWGRGGRSGTYDEIEWFYPATANEYPHLHLILHGPLGTHTVDKLFLTFGPLLEGRGLRNIRIIDVVVISIAIREANAAVRKHMAAQAEMITAELEFVLGVWARGLPT